jgi:glycerophosphoryl diester phosphodiesterase
MIPRQIRNLSPEHFLRQEKLKPFIFGHRGYSSRAPENSLPAFTACAEAGVPGIELDVHLTRDGHLVIIHDHSTKRTTGVEGSVEALSLQELKQLDIGSWSGSAFTGERIMTLKELLNHFGDAFYYDIELKDRAHGDSGIAAAAVTIIEEAGLENRCFLSSFNPYPLAAAAKLKTRIPAAIIYCTSKEVPWILRHGAGRFLASTPIVKPGYKQTGPLSMKLFRALEGRAVIPWTVDDPEIGRNILKLGADGLISNDPEIHLRNSGV